MLVARDQENLVARHQNGAALKQQQNGQLGNRYPKTPIKVPLNDENGGQFKGAKSVLGNRTKGNENTTTSRGFKGQDKSNFVTPMQPRNRAVLGDKTTNAKAGGLQTVNTKGTIREIERSQGKAPATIKPKQRQPQAETRKLQIHAEEADPLSEEEPEYCPPKPQDLPYESDVFPEGVLTFEGLKPENRLRGFYQYYFDPLDDDGVSKSAKEEAEKTRKALEESDKKIQEDLENLDWSSIQDEIDGAKTMKPTPPNLDTVRARPGRVTPLARRPLSTLSSRTAATSLSMDDATNSLQRKLTNAVPAPVIRKKTTSFAIPRFTGTKPTIPQPAAPRRTPMANIEANSRTTLGYNKGRAAASALAAGTTKPVAKRAQAGFKPKASGLPRSETTTSNDSNRTITPASFANKQVSTSVEDQLWKERVPFLSIFHPDEEEDFEFTPAPIDLEDEEFEMQMPE